MTETVTSADGTTIAFERIGHGPALILVDAASCFREFGPMRSLSQALKDEFMVYIYDRRGRGASTDTPPYNVDKEVDDLRSLIEAAGGAAFVHGFSSGAVLGLHAAARGLSVKKLTLLEPPVELDPDPSEPDLGEEVNDLIAHGRRGEAIEHFNRSIGVPDEMIAGLRSAPFWPALEDLAHTLAYDATITGTFTRNHLSAVTMPALVINSEATDDRLKAWGEEVASGLPNGSHRALPGEWHGVAPEALAPVMTGFFKS